MKISIILPTYNRADLILDAISSVTQQSIEDYELIVVDDGSTDNTREIVSEQNIENLKYIYTEHRGPAYARNAGMQAANGKYICYLDSDDMYYSFKLELQLSILESFNDVVMVYTEFSAFDDNSYWNEFNLKNYHKSAYRNSNCEYDSIFSESHSLSWLGVDPIFSREQLEKYSARRLYLGNIYDKYLENTIVFTNSMMFRKSAIEKIGLQKPIFGHFHDLEFALRLCKTGKVAFIDIPTYKLRYHRGQVSTTARSDGQKIAIKKQQDLLKVAKYHGLRDLNYYQTNLAAVNKLLYKLHRAVAIPLLSYDAGSKFTDKNYPRRARKYLAKCAIYGKREYLLYIASFSPHFIRRILFKIMSIMKTFRLSQ